MCSSNNSSVSRHSSFIDIWRRADRSYSLQDTPISASSPHVHGLNRLVAYRRSHGVLEPVYSDAYDTSLNAKAVCTPWQNLSWLAGTMLWRSACPLCGRKTAQGVERRLVALHLHLWRVWLFSLTHAAVATRALRPPCPSLPPPPHLFPFTPSLIPGFNASSLP